MCRLLFCTNVKKLAQKVDIVDFLAQLEISCGGHGNGFYCYGFGLKKGVNLTVEEIANVVENRSGPFMFHTRLASIGPVTNTLCQPFKIKKGYVCHNGHWSTDLVSYLQLKYPNGLVSDSLIISQLIEEFGFISTFKKFDIKGVVLYYETRSKTLYISKNSWKSLYYSKELDCFASEPYFDKERIVDWIEVDDGIHQWKKGLTVREKEVSNVQAFYQREIDARSNSRTAKCYFGKTTTYDSGRIQSNSGTKASIIGNEKDGDIKVNGQF